MIKESRFDIKKICFLCIFIAIMFFGGVGAFSPCLNNLLNFKKPSFIIPACIRISVYHFLTSAAVSHFFRHFYIYISILTAAGRSSYILLSLLLTSIDSKFTVNGSFSIFDFSHFLIVH